MKPIHTLASCMIALPSLLAHNLSANKPLSWQQPHVADAVGSRGFNVSREDSEPQLGSAEWLSTGGPDRNARPWPRRRTLWETNKGELTKIPYCFVDERSYQKLQCSVRAAIKLWADAIGKAGPENKHSLVFVPPSRLPVSPNFHPYCCNSYTYGEEGKDLNRLTDLKCDWNKKKYPADTLAIHWLDKVKNNGGAKATIGYYEDASGGDVHWGIHEILISEGVAPSDIAHELGHVLGMAHEHQRWDRDEYVQFKCENVRGMKEIVDKAYELNGRPNGITKEEVWEFLCEDFGQAEFWSAPSKAYIKGDGFDDFDEGKSLDGPDGFDYDSIMLYDSAMGAAVRSLTDVNIDTATLVKIKKNPTTGQKYVDRNDWRVERKKQVSEKDAAFVRRFYPWGAPWTPSQQRPAMPPNLPVEVEDPASAPQVAVAGSQDPLPPPQGQPPPLPPRPTRRPGSLSQSSQSPLPTLPV